MKNYNFLYIIFYLCVFIHIYIFLFIHITYIYFIYDFCFPNLIKLLNCTIFQS